MHVSVPKVKKNKQPAVKTTCKLAREVKHVPVGLIHQSRMKEHQTIFSSFKTYLSPKRFPPYLYIENGDNHAHLIHVATVKMF